MENYIYPFSEQIFFSFNDIIPINLLLCLSSSLSFNIILFDFSHFTNLCSIKNTSSIDFSFLSQQHNYLSKKYMN
jgi:hypothetical protein